MTYSGGSIHRARQLLALQKQRQVARKAIIDELFDIQRNICDRWLEGTRFFALCCSRRAGKTALIARMIAIALMSSGHNEWVVYTAKTVSIARDLIWAELVALCARHNLEWKMVEHEGTIITKTGAMFRLVGVADRESVEKVRGKRYRLVVLDEASTYQELLQKLINDAFRPGLGDLGGAMIVSGTPGYACAGYWYKAASGQLHYEVHEWTLLENPFFKNPEEELKAVLVENAWTEEEPSFRREWKGEWVNDGSTLVYGGFDRSRNLAEPSHQFDADRWVCTLAADYGMVDETALSILGSVKGDNRVYVLHSSKHKGLLPDEVSGLIRDLVRAYQPTSAVGDSGGLGATFVVEWNRRHAMDSGIAMKAAKKSDKRAAIELVNGAFRSSRLFVTANAKEMIGEMEFLPWYDEMRQKEHPAYDNHCTDTLLYAFREHTGYALVKPPEKPYVGKSKWSTVEERKARNAAKRSRPWYEEGM